MLALRDYQIETVNSIKTLLPVKRRVLAVLPTGAGKTICFAQLSKELGLRTLVLVHRDELVRQTVAKFKLVWPDVSVGIVQANQDDVSSFVTVASVQTISRPRRLARFIEGQNVYGRVGLVIVDEAHHAVAPTWVRVLDSFPGAFIVGFTATPGRYDKINLNEVFNDIAVQMSIGDLVRRRYLVPLRGIVVKTATSLDEVKTRGDDFAQDDLAKTVNNGLRNKEIVAAYLKYCSERKAIAFCASVDHAAALAEEFRRGDISAESISCNMPLEERRQILERFAGGEIRVLTNYGILTEGFDDPSVECIIMARPTKNRSLYIQMVGRGARISPGKKDCIILDVVDISKIHRLVQLTDLRGADGRTDEQIARDQARLIWRQAEKLLWGNVKDLFLRGRPVTVLPVKDQEEADILELVAEYPVYYSVEVKPEHKNRYAVLKSLLASDRELINKILIKAASEIAAQLGWPDELVERLKFQPEVKLVRRSAGERDQQVEADDSEQPAEIIFEDLGSMTDFVWVQVNSDLWMLQMPELTLTLRRRGTGWEAYCEKESEVKVLTPEPMPLDWALNLADNYLKQNEREKLILINKNAPWRSKEPTEKQIQILRENNLPVPKTRGEAADLLSQLFAMRRRA